MKKLFVIVWILTFALAACGNQQTQEKDKVIEEPKPVNEVVDTKVVQEFSNQITKANSPMDVKKNLDELILHTNSKTVDALVADYLAFQDSFLKKGVEEYTDEINSLHPYFNFNTESIDAIGIKESDLKEFYLSFSDSGFRLIALEGMLNPIVDYHFLDTYKTKVSPEISEYGSFMALNSDKPWARDAGIAIPLNDLADRIVIAEKYLSEYPNSEMKEKVISQYKLYLRTFLLGLDNTPLVNYGAKEVDASFIKAYHYFIDTYPEVKATKLVRSYVNDLESTKFAAPYQDEEEQAAFTKSMDEKIKGLAEQF